MTNYCLPGTMLRSPVIMANYQFLCSLYW